MDFKNLSRWEGIAVVFCLVVFISLSLIVVFRSEWLDNLFYGEEISQEQEVEDIGFDFEEEQEEGYFEEPVDPFVTMDIVSEEEGKASLVFNVEGQGSITGLELVLEKDEGLEFEDFECEAPFDCMYFEDLDSEVSLLAVIPPASVGAIQEGEMLVGSFIYSGTGSVVLNSDSETFLSTMEGPSSNVLHMNQMEFLLK